LRDEIEKVIHYAAEKDPKEESGKNRGESS